MENLVPLGTGNSRLMRSNIPAGTTWEQARAMLNAGTFPYDTGPLNAAGISQQGTPLNKATLLKDATAALFGLTNTAVPDDVLAKIADLIDGGPKIATGSYVGTGKHGSKNINILTFKFDPKLVIVTKNDGTDLRTGTILIYNQKYSAGFVGGDTLHNLELTIGWYPNKVQWFSPNSADYQLNKSGMTYFYWAIG